jgi:hypothetical protein
MSAPTIDRVSVPAAAVRPVAAAKVRITPNLFGIATGISGLAAVWQVAHGQGLVPGWPPSVAMAEQPKTTRPATGASLARPGDGQHEPCRGRAARAPAAAIGSATARSSRSCGMHDAEGAAVDEANGWRSRSRHPCSPATRTSSSAAAESTRWPSLSASAPR